MSYIISLDPAKVRDWSAISVLDMHLVKAKRRFEYDLIALNRKQKLPYDHPTETSIASWAVSVYKNQRFWGKEPPTFLIDATGVGSAVADILKTKGIPVEEITITTGNAATQEGSMYHVGKARLIGKFLGVFDAGKLHINPGLPLMPLLEREMLGFKAELTQHGNTKFEAQEGENDDLLLSLAQGI
ncbi:MAG: hypothetical protein WCG94_06480, partial [Methanothrix sp.]